MLAKVYFRSDQLIAQNSLLVALFLLINIPTKNATAR